MKTSVRGMAHVTAEAEKSHDPCCVSCQDPGELGVKFQPEAHSPRTGSSDVWGQEKIDAPTKQ